MRSVPLSAVLVAGFLVAGCGSAPAKKAEPCRVIVAKVEKLDAKIDPSSTSYSAESNTEPRSVLMGQVLMSNSIIANSPRCFDPRVVALAHKALDQFKKHSPGAGATAGN